jgi:hypothetical protein
VIAPDESATDRHRRDVNLLDSKEMESGAHADDVENCVCRSDLVEVNRFFRNPMRVRLGFSKPVENALRVRLHGVDEAAPSNDVENIREVAVRVMGRFGPVVTVFVSSLSVVGMRVLVVVMVGMLAPVFVGNVDRSVAVVVELDACRRDVMPMRDLGVEMPIVEREFSQFVFQSRRVETGVN